MCFQFLLFLLAVFVTGKNKMKFCYLKPHRSHLFFILFQVSKCDNCTKPHEEWPDCYKPCTSTCKFAVIGDVCTMSLCDFPKKCDCKQGYYRDPYTGNCVSKCDCPTPCRKCGNCRRSK